MRSAAEEKYLEICLDKLKTRQNDAQIAERTGNSLRTVVRALTWGRSKGVLRDEIKVELEKCLLEIREQREAIGTDLLKIKRRQIGAKAALFGKWLEFKLIEMELLGLYGKILNINLRGEILHGVVLLPSKMSPEEWAKEHGSNREPILLSEPNKPE